MVMVEVHRVDRPAQPRRHLQVDLLVLLRRLRPVEAVVDRPVLRHQPVPVEAVVDRPAPRVQLHPAAVQAVPRVPPVQLRRAVHRAPPPHRLRTPVAEALRVPPLLHRLQAVREDHRAPHRQPRAPDQAAARPVLPHPPRAEVRRPEVVERHQLDQRRLIRIEICPVYPMDMNRDRINRLATVVRTIR